VPNLPLRWGVIGAGDIVLKRVAPALRDSPACELVAVARARGELAESTARTLGAQRWHARWQDLVADPDVQSVYVATPVHVHAEQTVAAAEAGKHVLCEKPMAMDAGECDRMIEACRRNGVALGVAYYRRFYPAVARVKDIVASGEIGEPVFAQMNAFEWFDPPPEHPRYWLVDRTRAGGGPMMDFGCHRLEVLVNLFGPVRRSTGITANVLFRRSVEDTAAVLLQFEAGACASLAVTHAAREPQDTLHVFGRCGSIHCAALTAGDLQISTRERQRRESHPPASNVHRPLIEDFVASVSAGRAPLVDGHVGRAVAAIEDVIYADATTGG
jgi:predicted dehydrogenase